MDTQANAIPSGTIVLWHGDSNNLPAGWVVCDGTDSTPDLRGRFVLGAGGSVGNDPGTTGGEASVTLTTDNLPQHSHSYQAWSQVSDDWKSGGNASPGDGTGNANQSVQTGEAGSSASFSILPPFYCLYYIMKR